MKSKTSLTAATTIMNPILILSQNENEASADAADEVYSEVPPPNAPPVATVKHGRKVMQVQQLWTSGNHGHDRIVECMGGFVQCSPPSTL